MDAGFLHEVVDVFTEVVRVFTRVVAELEVELGNSPTFTNLWESLGRVPRVHSHTNHDLGLEVVGDLANCLVSSVDVGVIASSRISFAVICEG